MAAKVPFAAKIRPRRRQNGCESDALGGNVAHFLPAEVGRAGELKAANNLSRSVYQRRYNGAKVELKKSS